MMTANLRAGLLTAAAMLCFGAGDVITKILSQSHPIAQIMTLRGLFAVTLLGLWAHWRGQSITPSFKDPVNLARALCEVGVASFYFTALARLPIAEATSLLFIFPIFLTIAGALILRERVGWRRWLAVIAGFIGVLLIVRPGGALFTADAFWSLGGAVCIAARDFITRFCRPQTSSGGIAVTAVLFVIAAGLVRLDEWTPTLATSWLLLAGSSVIASLGFLCLVEGTRGGEVSFAAPFRYVGVPLAFFTGWLVFDNVPDALTFVGAGLVVGAGLFIALRERRLALASRRLQASP